MSGELLFQKLQKVENKVEKLKRGGEKKKKQRDLLGFHIALDPGRRKAREALYFRELS